MRYTAVDEDFTKRFSERQQRQAEQKKAWKARLESEFETDNLKSQNAEHERRTLEAKRATEVDRQLEESKAEARANSIH